MEKISSDKPITFGILTVSDRSAKGDRPDASGPALADIISARGWKIFSQAILPDDLNIISKALSNWADSGNLDIILTTGGTGFSPHDVTPEATLAVITKQSAGLVETMRAESLKITPHAMLSRAVAGIRGRVLIINLPGSPKGAVENFRIILPILNHAIELLRENDKAELHH